MEFRVLGPLEVHEAAGPLPLGSGRRLRTLLALFLCRPNQILSTDLLIESLWSEEPPPSRGDRISCAPDTVTHTTGTEPATGHAERPARHGALRLPTLRRTRRARLVAVGAARAPRPPRRHALACCLHVTRRPIRCGEGRRSRISTTSIPSTPRRSGCKSCVREPLEESFEIRLALGDHVALIASIQQAVDDYPLPRAVGGSAHAGSVPLGSSGGGATHVHAAP